MIDLNRYEVWFITGSQHLYGDETLRQVVEHSQQIAGALASTDDMPLKVVARPVQTTPDAIRHVCAAANAATDCVGLILWMHTFSPAKMWIGGLSALNKPFVHLHTQFNRDIPWSTIDMDYMNLHQSAHGDREFGYLCTRMGLSRKVVVGHWRDPEVAQALATWSRAACAWHDAQGARIARFGDNMRDVAVTEGDKVEAERRFGYAVNGYGLGDLVARVDAVGNSNAWAKAGVMIRETLEAGSAHAMVVVTPSNGVAFQRRPVADAGSESTAQGGLAAPYWVKLTRTGNTLTAERSADGVTWVSITGDAAASSAEIPMGSEVFIGLALTSHDASITTGAQFSEVSTSSNVTGQWETADVGVEQPTGGNAAETLYVALEDGAGRVAVVTHETAAVMSTWQEWQIPLSAFEGVSLGNVQMLYVGLGDRDNPSVGGAGLIFVDDIGVGHPADVE